MADLEQGWCAAAADGHARTALAGHARPRFLAGFSGFVLAVLEHLEHRFGHDALGEGLATQDRDVLDYDGDAITE